MSLATEIETIVGEINSTATFIHGQNPNLLNDLHKLTTTQAQIVVVFDEIINGTKTVAQNANILQSSEVFLSVLSLDKWDSKADVSDVISETMLAFGNRIIGVLQTKTFLSELVSNIQINKWVRRTNPVLTGYAFTFPVQQNITTSWCIEDTTVPVLLSADIFNIARDNIVLTYDSTLNNSIIPATTDYAENTGKAIIAVSIIGSLVTLTVDSDYDITEKTVEVDYTAGANPVQDLSGNLAADLVDQPVTNNIPWILADATWNSAGQWDSTDTWNS